MEFQFNQFLIISSEIKNLLILEFRQKENFDRIVNMELTLDDTLDSVSLELGLNFTDYLSKEIRPVSVSITNRAFIIVFEIGLNLIRHQNLIVIYHRMRK